MAQSKTNMNPKAVYLSAFRGDILLVSLFMHLLGLALPLALLQIYDRILPSESYGTATFLVLGVGIAIIFEAILRLGRQSIFVGLGARYEAQAMLASVQRLQHGDIAEIEKRGTAHIIESFRSIGQVRDFWSGQAGAALYELPFVALYIALIAYIGGWLAVFPLALFTFAILFAVFWNRRIARAAAEKEISDRQRRDFAWSMFNALTYLKSIGSERSLGVLWRRLNKKLIAPTARLETKLGWVRENATAIGHLSTVLIVSFGAVEVVQGNLTTGALAACTMLAGRSIGPAMASLSYWSQYASVKEAQSRVADLENLPPSKVFESGDSQVDVEQIEGRIEIQAPHLVNERVSIAPGEVVHLSGGSDKGRSALMNAIAGMSNDAEIEVLLDGYKPDQLGHEVYRDAVMLVPRQLALVPGSILNNLTLYDPRYNAEVPYYTELLGLDSHINQLRNGILTEVGPGTAEHLDEGIYQRIAIIRALLRKPRVLILDHAATGLDLDGVKRLVAVIEQLKGDTTVIISSYRESLVATCTQKLVLKSVEDVK